MPHKSIKLNKTYWLRLDSKSSPIRFSPSLISHKDCEDCNQRKDISSFMDSQTASYRKECNTCRNKRHNNPSHAKLKYNLQPCGICLSEGSNVTVMVGSNGVIYDEPYVRHHHQKPLITSMKQEEGEDAKG